MRNGKRAAAWVLVLTLLLSLFSCRKGTEDAEQTAQGQKSVLTDENGAEWMIHIYKPTDMEVPAGWEFIDSAGIDFDRERGVFRGLIDRIEEREDEDGEFLLFFDIKIAVWDTDGALIRETPLNDPERRMIGKACFDGDRLIACQAGIDAPALVIWNTETGEFVSEKLVSEIAGWDYGYGARQLMTDGEGNLYVGNGTAVTVLSPDFVLLNSIMANTFDMERSPDGAVWAVCPKSVGRALFLLDLKSGQKKEIAGLDENAAHLAFVPDEQAADGFAVLVSGSAGINRLAKDADGKWVSEEILNFANSNVSYNTSLISRVDAERMTASAGEDCLAFCLTTRGADGMDHLTPRIYKKAPDRDLSKVRTVMLAHDVELEDYIRYQIVKFNRERDDILITTLDYSGFNNEDDVMGGAWRLANDMANGLAVPDLVYGGPTAESLERLMHKGLTADLGAYLDRDPEIGREDIAGCVLRSFDDGEGGLWGIAPCFLLQTAVGLPSVLGTYADGWDLDGFLDFAESLPEGRILSPYACRETGGQCELDAGAFVGEDGVHFDSPSFVRYLRWRKELPTLKQLKKLSPAAGMDFPKELKPYYEDGSVALRYFTASDTWTLLGLPSAYDGAQLAYPGFPTGEGNGTLIETSDVFVIPQNAPEPEAAWEVIRFFLTAEELTSRERWGRSVGMKAYLPLLQKDFENVRSCFRATFSDGSAASIPPELASDRERLERDFEKLHPGLSFTLKPYCTEAEAAAALDLIQKSGRPYRNEPEAGLSDILREEISGYISGLGSAEDCAEKIQSRASIWFSENH